MERSAMRLKRKYVKKAENESKIEMKMKKAATIKNAADEEIRDSDAKVSDVKKKTENVRKMVTRKKRFEKPIKEANQVKSDGKKQAVKPKKAADQMKSDSTSTDDEIQSDGSTSSDEGMENDKIKSGGTEHAVKPIKTVDQMKSDGKKKAQKPKKAADQMKSDSTLTNIEIQPDGSSSSDEDIGDDELKSDVVISDAMKKTENVNETKKERVNPKKKSKLTVEGIKRNENLDPVTDHVVNSGLVENLPGHVVNCDGESVVAILSRMEGKLNSILGDRRTEKRMFSTLVCMPYNLKEDIISYNGKLIDSELFLKFATFLESVGGRSDGKIVCNMLHQIATPNLLSQFEWRETSPNSFQDLKNIIKVIHVAAEKKCSDKYDLTVCGEIIKTALRNARGLSKN